MRQMGVFVCRVLREQYPKITFELTKRAILFSFSEPIGDDDLARGESLMRIEGAEAVPAPFGIQTGRRGSIPHT